MDYRPLAKVIRYEPDTGHFYWAVDAGTQFKAGSRAGTPHHLGYWVISYKRAKYQAHRLAWQIMTGSPPTGLIDHANCDRMDNRWSNLREATHAQNMANARVLRKQLWPKGVTRTRNGFVATIQYNRKSRYLGRFETPEAAHEAYMEAERTLFGEFARAA